MLEDGKINTFEKIISTLLLVANWGFMKYN